MFNPRRVPSRLLRLTAGRSFRSWGLTPLSLTTRARHPPPLAAAQRPRPLPPQGGRGLVLSAGVPSPSLLPLPAGKGMLTSHLSRLGLGETPPAAKDGRCVLRFVSLCKSPLRSTGCILHPQTLCNPFVCGRSAPVGGYPLDGVPIKKPSFFLVSPLCLPYLCTG